MHMGKNKGKGVIIVGATSGLGRILAEAYISAGWRVGVAGRNVERLLELSNIAPDRVLMQQIDITRDDAAESLLNLVERLGGISLYIHCSGILMEEAQLSESSQLDVIETNVKGFARMVSAAYRYFRQRGAEANEHPQHFQIAAISSIAGTRGLSQLPSYSASKAFDIRYLEALRQRADAEGLSLTITDVRPGWTRTPLLSGNRSYLLEMDEMDVALRILKAIRRHRDNVVIGKRWKILTATQRLLPTCIWKRLHIPLWRDR